MADQLRPDPIDRPDTADIIDRPDTADAADSGELAHAGGTAHVAESADAAEVAHAAESAAAAREVTRSVDLDIDIAEVWHAVTDPRERSLWLDDPDARARQVRVDESTPGQRLVWTWWHPGDEGEASTVSVVLSPVDGGGTRVVVTETVPATSPVGGASIRAAVPSVTRVAPRSPSWVRCARDRWDSRLLGLELRFVAARVGCA